MKFETTIDSETVTSFKEVLQILEGLEELQSATTDDCLLQNLRETFSYYEGLKHDMLIDISNELGLQFEADIKNRFNL